MNNTEEEQREMTEAALILLSMSDAMRNSPKVPSFGDETHAPQTLVDDEMTEAAQSLLLLSTTAHIVCAEDLMSSGLASTRTMEEDEIPGHNSSSPASTAPYASENPDWISSVASVTSPVSNPEWAGLTADQQAVQQRRLDMTDLERHQHNLQLYDHVNARGRVIGRLWQTTTERRTFRQNQRRRGATLLRAATTRGRSFSNRHLSN